jgi:hypothetical protein
MNKCRGFKSNGGQCTLTVEPPNAYCWHHAPERAEARRRSASKAGGSRVNQDAREVRRLMDRLTTQVLSGEIDTKTAHAVVALQNIKLRSIEVERKLEEADVREEFEQLKHDLDIT